MATSVTPDSLDFGFAPELRAHVAIVPIEDEAVLYQEGDGSLHQLNATAAAVCRIFDGHVTLGDLVEDAYVVFGGDRDAIAADVLGLARELGRKGLLVGVRGDGEDAEAAPTDDSAAPAYPDAAPDA